MEWLPILLISGLYTGPCFGAIHRQHCLVETPKSWLDAQSYCRERGFDLATIDDMGTMKSLVPLVANKIDHVWMGLHGYGPQKWFWSLADDDFYKEGERDYRHFEGDTNLQKTTFFQNGIWTAVSHTQSHYAMCYDANKQGRDRYVLVRQLMNALEAREYCRDHHTDLVSIRNATENQVINEVSAGNSCWIGMLKDPWIWSDGRDSSFRFWVGATYYTTANTAYCGALGGFQGGRWTLQRCTDPHQFLCACNRQTVLKVKVRSDDLQDLNDPATKAAILKQIQQMVENATLSSSYRVTWKTRADGLAFTKE